ncbi:hypothetical protein AO715_14500 [Xanthomonas sp. Mitacek01]|nr:hypothetical protein AO715_14500 [Xanthomonas sp. Mitacek01]
MTLVELMIAIAIGMLLVLALLQVFDASRTAYQLSSGLARTQENGRFAVDILQRDIRMAGHMGCVNDQSRFLPGNVTTSRPALMSTFLTTAQQFGTGSAPVTDYSGAPFALRFDRAIEGFNAAGTASGDTLSLSATPTVATSNNWQPALDAGLYTALTTGTGRVVAGSDVLALRFFTPTGAQVTAFTPGTSTSITVDSAARLTEGVMSPGLFGIADCMQAGVFQASVANLPATGAASLTVAANGLNKTTFDTTPPFTIGQAMLYRAESVVYYVGLNGSGNPALYRLRYSASPGVATLTPEKEELVEGIESLQLQYGQDSNVVVGGRPTGNIGRSRLPAGLEPAANYDHAWRRVGLVQVGLLARSPESAAAAQREGSDVTVQLSALGVVMAPPNDLRYRAVYEDSIALRNRLFGN